jgi:hypothetical protein
MIINTWLISNNHFVFIILRLCVYYSEEKREISEKHRKDKE